MFLFFLSSFLAATTTSGIRNGLTWRDSFQLFTELLTTMSATFLLRYFSVFYVLVQIIDYLCGNTPFK